ncbi:DUF2911 domain-containing protein [Pedobacter sp. MC2016-05]|uniref:DUF2911 domain-containing protein n=1 Tax=Pedobacter sp. MC2016-05 TaxID=2994474 RepID=UPI002246A80A|nr:DUF2911 domain-containing protein [Pedobacter sp. MC2016-05]MCX2472924.1 DUF2911 domain-containing protein [Pedobacter sp. MC2016-05]
MKRIFIVVFALFCFGVKAQETSSNEVRFPAADPSPADIVYFPLNAPKAKDATKPVIKIVYSRPQRKGRDIFGVLEQYGKVWRFGANENTEVQFFKKVTIGGKKIKAGTYSLFAIPNKDSWTIIVNSQTDKWGAFSYDQTKDVVRTNVPVRALAKPIEYFSLTFVAKDGGANLIIGWDKTQAELPITF